MPVQIQYHPDDICVLRISGILKRSEFGAEQNALARKIDMGSKPRLLVIPENFEGWERGADWNDLDFLISHSGKISKIAIVAEPRWEALALAFAGAGVRRAPVKFFPPNELEQARNWCVEWVSLNMKRRAAGESRSPAARDDFLHRLPACRLQWPESASRQEPHAFVFVAAVHNIDTVTHDGVMKCATGVLGNESEEGFPPRIISVFEHFFPNRL